ncbi:hypothetical protein [Photobacterium damselae]|uniref:hypothetical protein n=1 Tax=Photobacterium damselae TaxID=38293 RepID=UPI001EDD0AAD|nr:hypothetical protein [Photobacterium damselae]MCG3846670.1 hypothetical protein [Photobacterium damselae]
MQKSAFEKISIGSAFENFFVFMLSGLLVVVIGGFFVDLTDDLPDWYLGLIQEPISIAYFFILSIVSLIATAIATWGGTKNHNEKWWFEKILLAPSRAGISCGFIASGMLIGIGAGLFLVTRGSPDSELATTSLGFVALGIYCLSVAYPVSVLMLYLINQNTKHNFIIDLFGAVYVALVLFAGYKFKEHMDWVIIGAIFAIFIVYAFISRKWLRATDNKSRNSNVVNAAGS